MIQEKSIQPDDRKYNLQYQLIVKYIKNKLNYVNYLCTCRGRFSDKFSQLAISIAGVLNIFFSAMPHLKLFKS